MTWKRARATGAALWRLPPAASAQESEVPVADRAAAVDIAWIVVAAVLARFIDITGSGLLYGGGVAQPGIQAVGSLALVTWVFLTSTAVFRVINRMWGLRVDTEEELTGLDRMEHGAAAYPEFMEQIADPVQFNPVS